MKRLNLGRYHTRATEEIAHLVVNTSLPRAVRSVIPIRFLERLTLNISCLIYRLAYDNAFRDDTNPLVEEVKK